MRILGIESSCDETGVAVYDDEKGLLSHVLHTQIAMHAEYGGVVPELASRDHIKRVVPLIRLALKKASITPKDLCAVAYTAGPGLIGALLTGAMGAVAYAKALDLPTVPVHHMEGHLLAPMLEDPKPEFPFVALLISGGHTMLIKVERPGASMMPQVRLLIKRPSFWGSLTRAVRSLKNWPSKVILGPLCSRVPCLRTPGVISVLQDLKPQF